MAKQAFMPRLDKEKQAWLQNFSNKLNVYATKYNIAAPNVADMKASFLFYNYWMDYRNQYDDYLKKLTAYKNELRDGVPPGATPSVLPVAPTMVAAPPAVLPGIFPRATAIALAIKKNINYTVADGEDLGIEGVEYAAANVLDAKPLISIRPVAGGHPEIVWRKGDMDALEIHVNRSGTETPAWQFLTIDTYPNYTDMAPLPSIGHSAVWQYKAIYRYGDEPTGEWSDIVNITVAGA